MCVCDYEDLCALICCVVTEFATESDNIRSWAVDRYSFDCHHS